MSEPQSTTSVLSASIHAHAVKVLLIDDQAMIGEAVRRMLAEDTDIDFHFCSDPGAAMKTAEDLQPTVILQDLVMPEVDGLTLVKFLRANPKTREIPLIVLSTKEEPKVKAEAFALGANDYLVKLPDKIELIARIRHHSQGYINLLERNEAFDKLVESQKALAAELAEAADYVKSLLPAPLEGAINARWKFVTSTSLGGDSFGYHWLDDQRLVIYLLDVCGHGVGAALLSVSAMEAINSKTLPGANFANPSDVLGRLNRTFQMDQHNDMYFTIWYGVYDKTSNSVTYASAGHPPALLFNGADKASAAVKELSTPGGIIGFMPDLEYKNDTVALEPFNKLFVFSDGVFEIAKTDGEMWDFEDFVPCLDNLTKTTDAPIESLYDHVRELRGSDDLDDDFSMIEFSFDAGR